MRRLHIGLLFCLSILVNCSSAQASKGSGESNAALAGAWQLPEITNNGVTFNLVVFFGYDRSGDGWFAAQWAECSGAQGSVVARVRSPIRVTADEIVASKGASDTETSDDGLTCTAMVRTGTLHYAVSQDGSRLTLSNDETGESATISRTACPGDCTWPSQE